MTSCRIERKRAHDREAQRASRAKTKAYISHLEKTVQELSQSGDDNRANYLAQHASKQAQEIDNLQSLMGKIRSLIQDAGSQSSPPPTQAQLKSEGPASDALNAQGAGTDLNGITWDSPSEDQWSEAVRPIERVDQQPLRKETSATRNLVILGVNMLCRESEDTTYFTRLNEAIGKVEQTPDNLSSLEEDEDILIRAIIDGWDAAEKIHHFDIAWRFLRAFDEGLWYRAPAVERAAHFWQMRQTMLSKIQPKNQKKRAAPTFMALTMAQKNAPSRPPVIDYFGWPAVRNQLVAQGIEGCSGRSTIAFAESFRFTWPYELRDIYKFDRNRGVYSISEAFLKSVDDMSCYRMAHNDLIPYYCHPSLAAGDPPMFDKTVETDSDESVADDEIATTHSMADIVPIPLPSNPATGHLMQECRTADWDPFGVDVPSDSVHYAVDPFSIIAYEAGLNRAQWPTL